MLVIGYPVVLVDLELMLHLSLPSLLLVILDLGYLVVTVDQ